MNQIEHLIILMMENRSFDHYFGALPKEGRGDVEGLPDPGQPLSDTAGNQFWPFSIEEVPLDYPGPPHEWDDAHLCWNGGKNDGFVKAFEAKFPDSLIQTPLGYYTRSTLSVLYGLADEFVVCDHWFASVLSSTWPNRKYLHSGDRNGDKNTQILPAPPGFATIPIYGFIEQCAAPGGGRLDWRCYYSDAPFLAFWYDFAASHANKFELVDHFAVDCRNNELPHISIIDPPFSKADDHPTHDPRLGEKFIGEVVDSLTNSVSWSTSALLIVYDEYGGFYDHAPPPPSPEPLPSEDTPLGFRVPAIVVSPYAKRRFVSKQHYDHTTWMKSIAGRWNLTFPGDQFGQRWTFMPSIWEDCFDFAAAPRGQGTYTPDTFQSMSWGPPETSVANEMHALLKQAVSLPDLRQFDNHSGATNTLGRLSQQVSGSRSTPT